MVQADPTITHKCLVKKIFIRGRIHALTGLHIGGSNMQLEIGGIDSAVIRNPFTNEPYIPGSSLKGKMRALMEQAEGAFGGSIGKGVKFGPSSDPEHSDLVRLFGNAKGDQNNIPSRLIVRDGHLQDAGKWKQTSEVPFTEIKTEVAIDRLTSTATPRQIERVPAGAEFSLDLVLNVWKDCRKEDAEAQEAPDTSPQGKEKGKNLYPELDEARLLALTFNALRLLQDDYLGGKGSRGSGQVKVAVSRIEERSADFYLGKAEKTAGYQPSEHTIPLDLQADA